MFSPIFLFVACYESSSAIVINSLFLEPRLFLPYSVFLLMEQSIGNKNVANPVKCSNGNWNSQSGVNFVS